MPGSSPPAECLTERRLPDASQRGLALFPGSRSRPRLRANIPEEIRAHISENIDACLFRRQPTFHRKARRVGDVAPVGERS
jgi:hypothetical protein